VKESEPFAAFCWRWLGIKEGAREQGRRRKGDVGSGDNPQILSDCCCNLQDGKWVAPQDFIQSPHGREDLAFFIAMECWSPQIEALICCKQIVNVREETKSVSSSRTLSLFFSVSLSTPSFATQFLLHVLSAI